MILTKKIIFKKTFLDIPLFLFFIIQIISTIFSIDKNVSLFGYYGRFNGGLISIFVYIFLFYAAVSNKVNFLSLLKVSLLSSFISIIYALPGKLNHDLTCILVSQGKIIDNSCWSTEINVFNPAIRAFSTLGQPNWFGAFLVVNFFIGLYFFLNNLNKKKQFFIYLSYLFLNFSFILFSRSKSSFLALIIGLIIFVIFYLKKIKKLKKAFISLFLIISFSIILFKTGIDKLDYLLNFKNLVLKNKIVENRKINNNRDSQTSIKITDSGVIRRIVWEGAIELGKKYPLFGTGVETFGYSYYFVRPKEHNLTSEWDFVYNKAHNEFLNYLATTGFVGFFSYLILIFIVIYQFFKNIFFIKNENINKDIYIFLLIIYLGILITNFFGFSTTTINLFFYIIPGFLVIKTLENEQKQKERKINFDISKNQLILSIILVLFFSYLFLLILRYWLADVNYSKALNYLKINDYQKTAFYLNKAINLKKEPIYLDKYSSILASLSFLSSYENNKILVKELISKSEDLNNQTIKGSPYNIFYWKTKIKNQYYYYLATGNFHYLYRGIEYLNKIKNLFPTDPKIYYTEALFYSLLIESEEDEAKKYDFYNKTLRIIRETLSLKKDFYEAIELKKEIENKINNFLNLKK